MQDNVMFWILIGGASIFLISRMYHLFLYFWRYEDLTISFGKKTGIDTQFSINLSSLYGPKTAVTLHVLYTLFVLGLIYLLGWVLLSS